MRTEGAAAIVTGGGSGLGAATAKYLGERGAKVALLDRDAKSIASIAKSCGGLPLECDVTDEKAMLAALAAAAKAHGPARIIINCAGVVDSGMTMKRDGQLKDIAAFRRVIDINLTGTWNVIRLAAAEMRGLEPEADGERGVMVNTASIAGLDFPPAAAAYVAAKAGVVAMTLALAREFAPFGIRVMAIAPGMMDTPMLASLPDAYRADMIEAAPFPKRFGRPEEFARLAGEIVGNSMLNGSTIRLDGAFHLIT